MRSEEEIFSVLPAIIIVTFYVIPIIGWVSLLWIVDGYNTNIYAYSLYAESIVRTISISGTASLIAVLIGGGSSILHRFSKQQWRWWITASMVLPLLTGFIARNYAWLGLISTLSNIGNIGAYIGDIISFNKKGEVLVLSSIFIPFAYFITQQGLKRVSILHVESALTMGVKKSNIFLYVVLPIMKRSVMIAYGVCFVFSTGYFVTPRMIGGGNYNFIGNHINMIVNDLGEIKSASIMCLYLILTLAIPIGLLLYEVAREREEQSGW